MFKTSILFAAVASTFVAAAPVSTQSNLIIFGNSLSDNGNIKAMTGSPAYWQGRYSNSYVWNEYTAKLLNMKLENHAYGGATSNNDLSPAFAGNMSIPSFHDQVNTWLSDKTHLNSYNLQNDVIGVEIGGNDVFGNMKKVMSGAMTLDQFAMALGNNIATDVGSLVKAGYKNIYVWNLPAVDKVPYITSMGLGPLVAPMVATINNRVAEALQPAISLGVNLLDFGALMNQAFDPKILAALGVTDSTSACYNKPANGTAVICSNPDNHLFYDGIHPASRMHYLWGVVASIYMRDPSHKLTIEEILQLIKKFDIGNSNVNDNLI
ncbi:hypothetical protein FBU59_001543, partial [Linderina macrospora]